MQGSGGFNAMLLSSFIAGGLALLLGISVNYEKKQGLDFTKSKPLDYNDVPSEECFKKENFF